MIKGSQHQIQKAIFVFEYGLEHYRQNKNIYQIWLSVVRE